MQQLQFLSDKYISDSFSNWNKYDRSDSFSFDYEPQTEFRLWFRQAKGKLSLRSYSFQFEKRIRNKILLNLNGYGNAIVLA